MDRRGCIAGAAASTFLAIPGAAAISLSHSDLMDPLLRLRLVEDGVIKAPQDGRFFEITYDLAVAATKRHPNSVEAWRQRAHHGTCMGLCTREPSRLRTLYGDVIRSGDRLAELGAREGAERAWADAAVDTVEMKRLFAYLDRRHDLRHRVSQMRYFHVSWSPPFWRGVG